MNETTDTGLPRVVAIAWGMHEVPQRGPARGLSHERIVAAAMDIADSEGLAAVTMKSVATSLGFTTMSLYRYVSSKDELLGLMQDAVLELPTKVKWPVDWQAALRQWSGLIREAYRKHPWALQIARGPVSIMMPNSVALANLGLGAMEALPLNHDDKLGLILVISQHAGSSVELEQHLAEQGVVAVSDEGVEVLGEVITAERFPHLAPLMEAGHYVVPNAPVVETNEGVDHEYGLGLDLIIAGLEQKVQSVSTETD